MIPPPVILQGPFERLLFVTPHAARRLPAKTSTKILSGGTTSTTSSLSVLRPAIAPHHKIAIRTHDRELSVRTLGIQDAAGTKRPCWEVGGDRNSSGKILHRHLHRSIGSSDSRCAAITHFQFSQNQSCRKVSHLSIMRQNILPEHVSYSFFHKPSSPRIRVRPVSCIRAKRSKRSSYPAPNSPFLKTPMNENSWSAALGVPVRIAIGMRY